MHAAQTTPPVSPLPVSREAQTAKEDPPTIRRRASPWMKAYVDPLAWNVLCLIHIDLKLLVLHQREQRGAVQGGWVAYHNTPGPLHRALERGEFDIPDRNRAMALYWLGRLASDRRADRDTRLLSCTRVWKGVLSLIWLGLRSTPQEAAFLRRYWCDKAPAAHAWPGSLSPLPGAAPSPAGVYTVRDLFRKTPVRFDAASDVIYDVITAPETHAHAEDNWQRGLDAVWLLVHTCPVTKSTGFRRKLTGFGGVSTQRLSRFTDDDD